MSLVEEGEKEGDAINEKTRSPEYSFCNNKISVIDIEHRRNIRTLFRWLPVRKYTKRSLIALLAKFSAGVLYIETKGALEEKQNWLEHNERYNFSAIPPH